MKMTIMLILDIWVSLLSCTSKNTQIGSQFKPDVIPTHRDTIVILGCPTTKIITIKKDQVLVIKLNAYPSRGYSWAIDTSAKNFKALIFKGRHVEEPDPLKMDGAPTANIFTIFGAKSGDDIVRFNYARPFDKPDTKPLDLCSFRLIVVP
jgi:predicted secreted protein